jgi:hypothetical protein
MRRKDSKSDPRAIRNRLPRSLTHHPRPAKEASLDCPRIGKKLHAIGMGSVTLMCEQCCCEVRPRGET